MRKIGEMGFKRLLEVRPGKPQLRCEEKEERRKQDNENSGPPEVVLADIKSDREIEQQYADVEPGTDKISPGISMTKPITCLVQQAVYSLQGVYQ